MGNNMFAYCLNNPIIFGDFTGEDAVILLDKDKVGHLGIMAQDKNGIWWHFYWGADPDYIALCILGIDVPVNKWCQKYTGEITLDAINESGQYDDYERMIYLRGDFSLSVEEMQKADGVYNLYLNNCSQVSLRILAKSNTIFRSSLLYASSAVLPSTAFNRLNISAALVSAASKVVTAVIQVMEVLIGCLNITGN